MLVTVLAPSTALALDWNWQSPLPQGNQINGCWGSSASDIFMVGEYGTILHFSGSSWTVQPSGTWYDLHDVWGTSSSNVWAVGNAGLILHYDGTAWAPFSSSTAWALYGIWGAAWNNVYAVGEGGVILRFNGSSWSSVNHGLTTKNLHDVWGSSASDIFAVGGSTYGGGVVLHSGGSSWTSQTSLLPTDFNPQLNAVWGTGPGNVYAVGGAILAAGMATTGHILQYNGSTWSSIEQPAFFLAGLWGASSSTVVAVGNEGRIMSFDGGSWSTLDTGLGEYFAFFAAWGTGASNIWAVGSRGLVYHFDGGSWSEVSSGFKDEIKGVWATGPDDIYVARYTYTGSDSFIDHYDGRSWTTVWESSSYGSSLELESIWGSSGGDIWAVGDFWSQVLHFNGSSWSLMTHSATASDMSAVWGTSGSNVYAVGGGRILHFDGFSWATDFTGVYDLQAIWGSGTSDIYAASREGEILHYNGVSWQEITDVGNLLFGLHGCGVNDVYAVGRDGTLVHYTGATWSQEAGIPTDYDLESVWCVAPNNVYAVTTSFGTVLHKVDGAWIEEYHSSLDLTTLFGNSASEVYAAGRQGAILRYGEPPLIFSDGFESGGTSRWSASVSP